MLVKLKVLVTAYSDHIIIDTVSPKDTCYYFLQADKGCYCNEPLKYVGMSANAFDIIKNAKRADYTSGLNEIIYNHTLFSWFGKPNSIFHKDSIRVSESFYMKEPHNVVLNTPSGLAIVEIDKHIH